MKTENITDDRASKVKELLRNASPHKDSFVANPLKKVKSSGGNFSNEVEDIRQKKIMLDKCGVENPYFRAATSVSNSEIVIGGSNFINFSGYNYLGYSGDSRVNEAAKKAVDCYGTSPSASRLVSGEKSLYSDLEDEVAEFLDCQASVVFPSGHATNVTVIGHLFNIDDLILYDELCHNSIIEGAVLSGSRRIAFKHNDYHECEKYIHKFSGQYKRVVIITEGVYSMDGDIAPIDEFVKIRRKYGVILYVDEAHSLGTIGESGRGIREYFNLKGSDVDFWMGTLSKSLSSNGGYIAGEKEIIEYLKYTTPGFVFTAGITPANAAAALESLRLLKKEHFRVSALKQNSLYFSEKLQEAGLNIGLLTETPIVPLIVGESKTSIILSDLLYKEKLISHPMFFPTVPEGEARLRFFITSEHTQEQLDYSISKITNCNASIEENL